MGGLFVSFEGVDRSGKTTQARLLAQALGDRAVLVREPGGTALGERLRALLKDAAVALDAHAEALLFAAARAQLAVEVVRPALAAGRVVVCDRFIDSSLAYQGAARGLGIDRVLAINDFALEGLRPDVTFLLAVDPSAAAARAGESDRFESEGMRLQRAVADGYEELARRFRERFVRVAADRPVTAVHEFVLRKVQELLAVRARGSAARGATPAAGERAAAAPGDHAPAPQRGRES